MRACHTPHTTKVLDYAKQNHGEASSKKPSMQRNREGQTFLRIPRNWDPCSVNGTVV